MQSVQDMREFFGYSQEGLPLLEKVIYWDDIGLWDYDDTILLTFT